MASYFNLGTDAVPRWINLHNIKVVSAKKIPAPGSTEVFIRGGFGKDEMVRGELADRLLAQMVAEPEQKMVPGS